MDSEDACVCIFLFICMEGLVRPERKEYED